VTAGFLSTDGRSETEEGIDKKLATHFYGRFLLIKQLTPLLEAAASAGEEARAMSVLGAGKGGAVPFGDLDLKKGFSVKAAADAATMYNDLVAEVSGALRWAECAADACLGQTEAHASVHARLGSAPPRSVLKAISLHSACPQHQVLVGASSAANGNLHPLDRSSRCATPRSPTFTRAPAASAPPSSPACPGTSATRQRPSRPSSRRPRCGGDCIVDRC
jgi:hypothetical protein